MKNVLAIDLMLVYIQATHAIKCNTYNSHFPLGSSQYYMYTGCLCS